MHTDDAPRDRLLKLLKRHGSLHVARAARLARLPWSTARDHLHALEIDGVVASRRDGRRRFYQPSTDARALPRALAGTTARRLARTILRAPGSTARELCALADVSRRVAYYHTRAFTEARLVVAVGEPARYFPLPRLNHFLRFR